MIKYDVFSDMIIVDLLVIESFCNHTRVTEITQATAIYANGTTTEFSDQALSE